MRYTYMCEIRKLLIILFIQNILRVEHGIIVIICIIFGQIIYNNDNNKYYI